MPAWYTSGKFGIFIHWGVCSVPAFGNEWYARQMYQQGSEAFEHHLETYGPHEDFGYKDFIPEFTMHDYDAADWSQFQRVLSPTQRARHLPVKTFALPRKGTPFMPPSWPGPRRR